MVARTRKTDDISMSEQIAGLMNIGGSTSKNRLFTELGGTRVVYVYINWRLKILTCKKQESHYQFTQIFTYEWIYVY